jgi:flagellar assembly protein FliH
MHSQPHSLVRPKRDAKMPAPKAASYADKSHQSSTPNAVVQNKSPGASPDLSLEELRALAYREGYAKGMQEGHAAGKQAGFDIGVMEGRESGMRSAQADVQAASEQKSARFEQLIRAISEETVQRMYMLEEEMVSVVYGAVCRIVGQVAASEEGVKQTILQAVSELRSRPMVSIRISSDDFAWLQTDNQFSALLAQLNGGGSVRLLADESVKLGGCIIDSPEGSLDARLDTQLKKICATLLQVFHMRAEHIKSGVKP